MTPIKIDKDAVGKKVTRNGWENNEYIEVLYVDTIRFLGKDIHEDVSLWGVDGYWYLYEDPKEEYEPVEFKNDRMWPCDSLDISHPLLEGTHKEVNNIYSILNEIKERIDKLKDQS